MRKKSETAGRQWVVGLVMGSHAIDFHKAVILGAIRYGRRVGTWRFHTTYGSPLLPDESIDNWDGDGLITAHGWKETLDLLAEHGGPAVSVSNAVARTRLHRVINDDEATGELGARHLMALGKRSYAFVRRADYAFSRQRERGFRRALEAAGYACATHYVPVPQPIRAESFMGVLETLSLPSAIMTATDPTAFCLLEACQLANLRVPRDVAVLGVDNSELMCQMYTPTVSSIERDGDRIGWEAARVLDRLMRGEKVRERVIRIPPRGVVQRGSTNVLYAADEAVDEAIQYIRSHAGEPITVSDVVRAVPVSRRTLEYRFREKVGRTIYDEIRRSRVERAKELLRRTDWPLARIAIESGFTDRGRLHAAFNTTVGRTPEAFRASATKGGVHSGC